MRPEIQMKDVLTMNQAIRIALREQPRMAAQSSRLDIDKAAVKRSRSEMLPYIQAGGVGNLGPTVINGFNGLFAAAARGNFGFDANGRWTLWDFGANYHRLRATKAEYRRSQQDFQIERARTILNTKLAYLGVLAALELKRIAHQDLKNRQLIAQTAQHMFETGLTSKLDWQQAEVDLAQSRQGVQEANRQVALAFNALNQAMGRDPDRQYKLAEEKLPELPAQSVSVLLEEGRSFRPCLIAEVKRIEAARERVIAAKREYLPKIDAIGGAGYLDVSAILQGSDNRYLSGAIVAFTPLFTGGRLEADLAASKAGVREASANYKETEQRIAREIVDAFESFKATYAKYQTSQEQARIAVSVLEYATERYKAQLTSYLEVSVAQTLLTTARGNLARNKFEFESIDALFKYAVGRDYLAYKF